MVGGGDAGGRAPPPYGRGELEGPGSEAEWVRDMGGTAAGMGGGGGVEVEHERTNGGSGGGGTTPP